MKIISELPLVIQVILIIGLVAIVIVLLLTQKGLVSRIIRKYLKLNTDDETAKFGLDMSRNKNFVQDLDVVKTLLNKSKKNK